MWRKLSTMSAAKRSRSEPADESRETPSWPAPLPSGVVLETARKRRMLNITGLDDIEKRLVWECLKRRKPALAELLKDPALHQLREAFNGKIYIELD